MLSKSLGTNVGVSIAFDCSVALLLHVVRRQILTDSSECLPDQGRSMPLMMIVGIVQSLLLLFFLVQLPQ